MARGNPRDPRWRPDRVGRISWRMDETQESWLSRKAMYEEEERAALVTKQRERERKNLPYAKRKPGTLQTLRELWGVSDYEIQQEVGTGAPRYTSLVAMEPPRGVTRARRRTNAGLGDGLDDVRLDMFWWVGDTHLPKESEAICDLDCCGCPRARLLGCAAQNASAASDDGYVVHVETLTAEEGQG